MPVNLTCRERAVLGGLFGELQKGSGIGCRVPAVGLVQGHVHLKSVFAGTRAGMRWTVKPATTGEVWAGAPGPGPMVPIPKVMACTRGPRLARTKPPPFPTGDSKEWKQLSAVERLSAQWLGYDEKRWKVIFLFGVLVCLSTPAG